MKNRQKTKQIVAALATGAVLTSGAVAAAPSAGAATPGACAVTESWPAATNGRPAAHPATAGVYLWHTDRGWRLRVNEPGADRAVFSGSITVDGQLVSWGRHLENRGEGTVTRTGTGVAGFRFVNYGGVDGLNFVTRCSSTLTVRVKLDGVTVPADHIFVGADGHHPDAVPTVVRRAA
ncbi:MAG: hypothetical protein ACXVJ7_01155 [Acidimicrobiia bacterium]